MSTITCYNAKKEHMTEEPLKKVLQRAMREIVQNDIPENIEIIKKDDGEILIVEKLERSLFLATEVQLQINGETHKIKYDNIESFKKISKN